MKTGRLQTLGTIIPVLALVTVLASTESAADAPDESVGANLPPGLRGLLLREMNAALEASKRILDALVRGQDEVVARNAQAIHDSFILAQEMTPADRETLRESLPDAFIERDRIFHEISDRLARAARAKDRQRQLQLFADMIAACRDCHSHHAGDRFPGFSVDKQAR